MSEAQNGGNQMERLTQRLRTGEVLMASEYEEKYTEQEWISVLQDRLAAYEDTDLTPEEVLSMKFEWCAMMDALNSIGGGYTRLRELAEADRDGRLVVPPCDEIGKTVFLTREKAEKALEAKKDE